MSLSSRGLLTKIYESDVNASHKKLKQKSILNFNSEGKTKKTKKKKIISPIMKENEKKDDTKNIFNINNSNKKSINKTVIRNILEEKNINKFPIIPQINITNIKIINENQPKNSINETKNQEILEKDVKLDYNIIESSSQDDQHLIREIKKGLSGQGWQSSRFCQYPQYIYVQFSQPVLVKRIDMILHETNIPSMIKFYSYYPKDKDEYFSNYKLVNYDYIGFIRTDNNERTNFEARESRKIYINSKSLFLKLELEKNYFNNYNLFNQIGILKLEFIGDYLPYIGGNTKNNKSILNHALKKRYENDMDLETICGQQLNELKKQMNYNIEIENYLECKEIKKKIEKVKLYGKRIFDLEEEKKLAINNEDFSKAIEIKHQVDKMKINLQNIDNITLSPRLNDSNLKFNDIDNQTIQTRKFSNIPLDLNNIPAISNSYEFSVVNESVYSGLNDNNNNNFNYNSSTRNNNITISNNFLPQNKLISEDIFGSYDERILPTVLKRLNHEETKQENELGEAEKGELEPISPKTLEEFSLISNSIGEENMRKIFSKQILWKEEGLKYFIEKIDELLKNNNSNDIISSILKLSMKLLEETHPSSVIKTLEIIKKLFECIKHNNIKLNIDSSVTDGVLIKIKEKLGDVNPKVRSKSVALYCYMLSLNFCDYNNLISELVQEEIKNNNKYVPKSSSLILGKMDIFINIFNNFDESIQMKRTSKEEFPSALVMEYLICNVSNSKPEVRRKTRNAISLFLKIFGIPKFKKKLEKIDERELIKLINEIPSLANYFPNITINNKNDNFNNIPRTIGNLNNIKKKKISKLVFKKIPKKIFLKSKINPNLNLSKLDEKEKNNISNNENKNKIVEEKDDNNDKDNNIKQNKIKKNYCSYCKKYLDENQVIANHWTSDCPMFTKCEKCSINLEVSKLNHHREKDCKFKKEFKLCNNCSEYILKNDFDIHKKSKCSLQKGFIKCPLCHQDITESDSGFYQHLIEQGCPSQIRKM